MQIILIAALSPDRVIGDHGRIPWRYPEDQQRFKELTMGHPVIMGRKTYESLRRPLKGRRNMVLTRREDFIPPSGVLVFRTLAAALERCREDGCEKAFIGGGTEVYRMALPNADVMMLTHVPDQVQGDAHFPEWNAGEWEEVDMVERGGLRYSTYRRTRPTAENREAGLTSFTPCTRHPCLKL